MSAAAASLATRIRLAGVEFIPPERLLTTLKGDRHRLQQALGSRQFDPRQLPPPRLPVLPVYEDEKGNRFALQAGPSGPVAVPLATGPRLSLAEVGRRSGGFVSMEDLRQLGAGAQLTEAVPAPQVVRDAAVRVLAEQRARGMEGANPFAELARGFAVSMAQRLAGMALKDVVEGAGISAVLGQLANPQGLATSLGLGAVQHLSGMATQLALNSLWKVDDESSTAEHALHRLAEEFANRLQGELLKAALSGANPVEDGSTVLNFFAGGGGPALAAVRQADVDSGCFPVTAGSPNVLIEGKQAGRAQDPVLAPGIEIVSGAPTVKINGQSAAHVATSASKVGPFATAAATTFIGVPRSAAAAGKTGAAADKFSGMKGKKLVVLVGGAGDSSIAPLLGASPVKTGLNDYLDRAPSDPDLQYFTYDQQVEAAQFIREYDQRFPGSEIEILGHSWGADSALDIAGLLDTPRNGVQIDRVVTLDGVAWVESDRPGNIGTWVNAYVQGVQSFPADYIADVGGHWGYESAADTNIAIRPGTVPTAYPPLFAGGAVTVYDDRSINHADTVEMLQVVEAVEQAGLDTPIAAHVLHSDK